MGESVQGLGCLRVREFKGEGVLGLGSRDLNGERV